MRTQIESSTETNNQQINVNETETLDFTVKDSFTGRTIIRDEKKNLKLNIMAKIKLLPDEEEALEVIKEEQEIEKKKILKLFFGELYCEDPNVLSFLKDNWFSELEKYYKLRFDGEINYQKKFEALIDEMDELIQAHKVKDAY